MVACKRGKRGKGLSADHVLSYRNTVLAAHHHFSDAEWDGEPQDPDPRGPGNHLPTPEPPEPKDPDRERDTSGQPRRQKARIMLGDGKERSIQHMMVTSTPLLMQWMIWGDQKKSVSSSQASRDIFTQLLPDFCLVHEGLSLQKESA